MPQSDDLILGVDIGGTKVAAALIDFDGNILFCGRVPWEAHKSAREGLQSVTRAIHRVMLHRMGKNVRVIGVSAPGYIDLANGVILKTSNLPCWRNFPLLSAIESQYELPTHLANDANAAVLAEAKWGAGVGYTSVFYASLGTGVGTGMVLQNRLYLGSKGHAGEGAMSLSTSEARYARAAPAGVSKCMFPVKPSLAEPANACAGTDNRNLKFSS